MPSNSVIGIKGNEISAWDVRGTTVRGPNSLLLGTVTHLLLDRKTGKVTLAGLDRPGGKPSVVVPWNELHKSVQEDPELTTDLGLTAIASAPRFQQTAGGGEYVDLLALLNRPVALADGHAAGTVKDMVVATGSGTVDYLVVQNRHGLGTGNAGQAILWTAVDKRDLGTTGPVKLNVSQQALAAAPLFGLKATLPQEGNSAR